MSRSILFRVAAVVFAACLVSTAAQAEPSNKWRLQFSGKANSDGVIVIRLSPVEGDPITAEVSVENNTGENGVAKTVVKSLKTQLDKEYYHVERDDGEDVLIKKRWGKQDFDLEIVSNSVEGIRIRPERE